MFRPAPAASGLRSQHIHVVGAFCHCAHMGPAAVAGIALLQSGLSNSGHHIWECKQVHCGVPQFSMAGWTPAQTSFQQEPPLNLSPGGPTVQPQSRTQLAHSTHRFVMSMFIRGFALSPGPNNRPVTCSDT
ncbi:hypothetical protein MG293_000149 [Ovis ammon polii]|uniref:Uncharacterized protein n=1 Tax=Ovis ammon polii TaxID=230172 RepID=A0AAD4UPQ0_OVIAM|nr:hypothetical protein MG293_000149 [Ovis ammon polii]